MQNQETSKQNRLFDVFVSALSESFFVSFLTFSRQMSLCETLDPGFASSKVKSGEVKGKKKVQSAQEPMSNSWLARHQTQNEVQTFRHLTMEFPWQAGGRANAKAAGALCFTFAV